MIAFKNKVFVKKISQETQTESGIMIKGRLETFDKGQVLSVGNAVESDIKVGDVVLVNWSKATPIRDTLFCLLEEDIIGVFE